MGVQEEVTQMLKRAAYKGYVWSWDGKVVRNETIHAAYDPETHEAWHEFPSHNEPLEDLGFKRMARDVWGNFTLPSFIRVQVV